MRESGGDISVGPKLTYNRIFPKLIELGGKMKSPALATLCCPAMPSSGKAKISRSAVRIVIAGIIFPCSYSEMVWNNIKPILIGVLQDAKEKRLMTLKTEHVRAL